MPDLCYALLETRAIGCKYEILVIGVTFNQQYAYNWQQEETSLAIAREARQVPFIE